MGNLILRSYLIDIAGWLVNRNLILKNNYFEITKRIDQKLEKMTNASANCNTLKTEILEEFVKKSKELDTENKWKIVQKIIDDCMEKIQDTNVREILDIIKISVGNAQKLDESKKNYDEELHSGNFFGWMVK